MLDREISLDPSELTKESFSMSLDAALISTSPTMFQRHFENLKRDHLTQAIAQEQDQMRKNLESIRQERRGHGAESI